MLSCPGPRHAGTVRNPVTEVCFCSPGCDWMVLLREAWVKHSVLLHTALEGDIRTLERGACLGGWSWPHVLMSNKALG